MPQQHVQHNATKEYGIDQNESSSIKLAKAGLIYEKPRSFCLEDLTHCNFVYLQLMLSHMMNNNFSSYHDALSRHHQFTTYHNDDMP